MADSKTTALSELSVPALTDLLYTIDDPGGTPVSNKLTTTRALGLMGLIPGGRLTITTGVPVSIADVTAAGTLYYTPYVHNLIRVWDGTRWLVKTFAEISLALTLTSGKLYDVFVDDDAATLSLSAAWTNDTTRADALGTQDSVGVLNSDKTKLWLGTIYASGANTTEDSLVKRFVWNNYNQVPLAMRKADASVHSYNSSTPRSWNNSAANQAAFVTGAPQHLSYALMGDVTPAPSGSLPAAYAIIDWTSGAGTSDAQVAVQASATSLFIRGVLGPVSNAAIAAGYHYIRAVEADYTGTGTFEQYRITAEARF